VQYLLIGVVEENINPENLKTISLPLRLQVLRLAIHFVYKGNKGS